MVFDLKGKAGEAILKSLIPGLQNAIENASITIESEIETLEDGRKQTTLVLTITEKAVETKQA